MNTPDYTKYTLSELQDVLNNINYEKYPERVKEIESILNDPVMYNKLLQDNRKKIEEHNQLEAKSVEEGRKAFSFLTLFILACVTLVTGTLITGYGTFQIESWLTRIFIFIIIIAFLIYSIRNHGGKSK